MSNKTLFVHFHDLHDSSGGAKRAFQNYLGCCAAGPCDRFKTGRPAGKLRKRFDRYFHSYLFINHNECKELVLKIREGQYGTVFFDTSLYGDAVKYIKQKCPSVRAVVHYHNFEKKYFEDEAERLGTRYYARRAAACEASASEYSDYRVFISEEDRADVCREYGCSPDKSAVIPVALTDTFTDESTSGQLSGQYVLFLGSSFFANDQAVQMLIDDIAPKANKKIAIVGKGMKERFPDTYPNTEVLGFVPSLEEVMCGASAFVSPVTVGSGSKIKIADALMRGKYIIATRSSLCGYDTSRMKVSLCETPGDFIQAINEADGGTRFYPENRALFLEAHDLKSIDRQYAFLSEG